MLVLFSCSKEEASEPPIPQYNLTVTLNPPDGGLVNPQTGVYTAGQTVTIQISENTDYVFAGWTGDWVSNEEQITIAMDSNKTLTANFNFLDGDNDGIGNSVDSCGGTSDGVDVDSYGCALYQLDSDNDGVTDDIDLCVNTDSSAIVVNQTGCEIDLFYLDDNGVTIKAADEAEIGMQDEFNGNIYTVVSKGQLRNMIMNDEDILYVVTTKITDMNEMFRYANDGYLDISNWDISSWDVSNVTDMRKMFQLANNFNSDISSWDVSSVTDMSEMFNYSDNFNSDISSWDVSNVTDMGGMFERAPKFNKPIGGWDVSSVTNMETMFAGANNFNGDISGWDVSSVTSMRNMFYNTPFNQPIGSWDVSSVTDMRGMFQDTDNFNSDISSWDVSSVDYMSYMFYNAENFNQDLSSWNVVNVVESFKGCTGFSLNADSWTLPKPNFTNCNPN